MDQYQIAISPARYKVLACGRRWGKTVLGGVVALNALRHNGKVAWVVPNYSNSRPLWRWCMQAAWPAIGAGSISVNRSDKTLSTRNGGLLGIYTADNIDAIRGESFNLAVLDEAARIPSEAWTDAISPTLADANGSAFLISTPKGRNWFWHEFHKGIAHDPHYASWTAPTSDNPNPNIRDAAIKAQRQLPERAYRQEWLAQFIEDGGEVFRRVRDAAISEWQDMRVATHEYAIGVDWGRSNDFTVFAVVDIVTHECVHIERSNQVEYAVQQARLMGLCEKFNPLAIVAETNAMGEPIIEQLRRAGLPIIPFTTTNASKQVIIDDLVLAFETGSISIVKHDILISELEAFTSERLPSGLIRYGAPDGAHDDCVMALALAWSASNETSVAFGYNEGEQSIINPY